MAEPFEVSVPEPFETQQPESRLSPWRLISRHWMLLVLGAVVGCVVGALYYAQATPYYESSLQVLVVNKSRANLPVSDSSGGSEKDSLESDLATQQSLIRSPVVVSAAVKEGKLTNLPSFQTGGDPTGTIIQYLKVAQETNGGKPTSVLTLTYRWINAQDIPHVLTAVIESYKRFIQKRYQSVADETAKLIVEANDLLEKKITKKQEAYDAFLKTLPTELWKGKDGLNSVQVQLMSLEARRVEMLNRQADLQGRIQAIEAAMTDGRHSRAELLTMINQGQLSSGEPGIGSKQNTSFQTTDRLLELKLEEKNLLEGGFGPDHPKVRAVRDQLALLQGRVKFSNTGNSELDADPVQSHYQAWKLELEYIRMASETLDRLLQNAHKKAKPLRSLEIQNESYRTDIARSQQLFDAIAKRLDELSIVKNVTGGYEAEVINPPRVGLKVAPKALAVFLSALVLGLLSGLGLAYLAEMSDQSFRTPEEIRRRLGLPVVGHIPFFAPEDEENLPADAPRVDTSLCAFYRPKSREAEAYRGVRTALFFNRGGGHSLIQVTSPDMSDGKSTLLGNLAVSIAQAEKKVILVDADFRRPRVHKLFNLSAEKGMASVMSGESELPDVILETSIPGLSILPCGPIPPNPAELLTLPRFREALAYLREKFDYVLVDTPPLLAVTDPCTVVPYVDGVLLTIRISKNARPSAVRAKEILSTLGAKVIGVVVNGVGTDARGYGYGGYRYGYGGYRYGYSYSYKNYYTYSNYQSDASSSSGAGGEVDGREETATHTKKQLSAPGRGFFTWLFKR